jgi:hypothetical protein
MSTSRATDAHVCLAGACHRHSHQPEALNFCGLDDQGDHACNGGNFLLT